MNLFKRLTFPLIVITLLLATLPCHANTFENVLKSGILRVGVSMYEPWVLKNKEGALNGFEIQLAKQIANDMGVKPSFIVVDWKDLINKLEANEFDVIISGMAITPERALRVNFTNPYASSGISIAANIAQTRKFNSLKELNSPEVKIATVTNTVSEKLAGKVFENAEIQPFNTADEAINAVINGKVHALVESSPVPEFLALSHPNKVDIPLSKPLLSYKTGMAINKGEYDFLNYLNSWIIAREAEGWLSARHKHWFDSLDWKRE